MEPLNNKLPQLQFQQSITNGPIATTHYYNGAFKQNSTAAANTNSHHDLLPDTLLGSILTISTAAITAFSDQSNMNNSSGTAISSSLMNSLPNLSNHMNRDEEQFDNSSVYWDMDNFDDIDFLYRHSLTMSTVYCIAYIIVFLVGLVGNSFVIAVVLRMRNMRTVTNYFIVNLAVADILVIVFCLPATLMSNLFVRKYSNFYINS